MNMDPCKMGPSKGPDFVEIEWEGGGPTLGSPDSWSLII